MLARNKGFCVPKHYLLGMFYERLGLSVQYCTYSFLWKDLDVDYPPELKKMAQELSVTYHLACKAKINNNWVLVDATWDSALKKANFPVNENWNGESGTVNAVAPIEEFVHAVFVC